MFLSEALAEYDLAMIGEKARSTAQWYRVRLRSLAEFVGDVEIETLAAPDLRRWRVSLFERKSRWATHPTRPEVPGGLAPSTIQGYVRAVRAFFNWLVLEGLLDSSPAARLKLPPKSSGAKKAVDPDDVMAMIAVANVRDRAIIYFLADTACRVGGLCSLTLSGLDLKRRQAIVVEKGRGGGKVRTVYFGVDTAVALSEYLEVRAKCVPVAGNDEASKVFWGTKCPLGESGVYQMLKRVALRAGIEGRWNPHAFRHGWAKGALLDGADMGTVADVLHHSSIQVTWEHYGRWAYDELAVRQQKFSWINNRGGG